MYFAFLNGNTENRAVQIGHFIIGWLMHLSLRLGVSSLIPVSRVDGGPEVRGV